MVTAMPPIKLQMCLKQLAERDPFLVLQGEQVVAVSLMGFRPQLNGSREAPCSLAHVTHGLQRVAEAVIGVGKVGAQFDSAAAMLRGIVEAIELPKGVPEVAVRFRRSWGNLQGSLKTLCGLADPALAEEYAAEVGDRVRVARVNGDSAAASVLRFVDASLLAQHAAQADENYRQGPEFGSSAEAVGGFVQTPGLPVGLAEVENSGGFIIHARLTSLATIFQPGLSPKIQKISASQ